MTAPGGVVNPPALRGLLVAAGVLLLVAALRTLLHRGRPQPARHLTGRVLLIAAAAAARLPGLQRSADSTALATRLAAAPESWPARWTAAALRAQASATERHPDRTPADFRRIVVGVRLTCAVAASPAAAVLSLVTLGPGPTPLIAAAAAAAASRLPDAVLARAARSGVRTARHDTAATVDLLAASASAGLSLQEAMVLTAAHAAPPLAASLRAAAVRRAMGDEPRQALTAEATRHGLPLLGDVAEAMDRQRRLGVPLGLELAAIAARMRAEQRAASLRRAARRGPVATLVVALVIAPTCLAAVVACLAGGLLQGGALPLR